MNVGGLHSLRKFYLELKFRNNCEDLADENNKRLVTKFCFCNLFCLFNLLKSPLFLASS